MKDSKHKTNLKIIMDGVTVIDLMMVYDKITINMEEDI